VAEKKYYVDMVAYMDKIVGRIENRLEGLGLRENTLILFTGDNGTPKGITSVMKDGRRIKGGKGMTTDAGTHVALIANWKGTTAAGKVCGDLVDFSDFVPTLADAAGASLPKGVTIDGRSFVPQLCGEKGNPKEWIFCHYGPKHGRRKLRRFVRDKRWKLYANGELYDLAADGLEESANPSGKEATAARERLQSVLDSI
jgi:arylsulfatase A